jgi:CBS domain-containing protein
MDWRRIEVEKIMSAPVKAITAGSTLAEAIELLSDEHIGGAVVTSAAGKPLGVVSATDILAFFAGQERGAWYFSTYPWPEESAVRELEPRLESSEEDVIGRTNVEAVMTPEVLAVDIRAKLPEAIRLMARRGVHRVLVLRDGAVAGIVSTMDVVKALEGATNDDAPPPLRASARARTRAGKGETND